MTRSLAAAVLATPVLASAVFLSVANAGAGASRDVCPGITTTAMTSCTAQGLQRSDNQLRPRLGPTALRQWQQSSLAVCKAAHAASKGGSLYPLQLIGCRDALNRTLLLQFQSPER